jgi:competence ComEA-like helix-hairpin-helix protein
VAGSALALPPAGNGQHTMVMALAGGQNGRYDEIHDLAFFPLLEHFVQPRMRGVAGYTFGDGSVELSVGGIENPRAEGNISGTLALELWALPTAYTGGAFEGNLVSSVQIGSLAGQSEWSSLTLNAAANPLPAGSWNLSLMLREWSPVGFVTRDYVNFVLPYVVEAVAAAAPGLEAGASVTVAPRIEAQASQPQEEKPAAKVQEVKPAAKPQAAAPAVAVAEKAPSPAGNPAKETVSAQKSTKEVVKAEQLAPAKTAVETTAKGKAETVECISVNTATAEQLASLKGLSKTVAKAIVAARPFKSVDDVVRAKGMGDKLFAKLRSRLTL